MLSNFLADASSVPSGDTGLIISVLIALIGSAGLVGAAMFQSRKGERAIDTASTQAEQAGQSAGVAKLYAEEIRAIRDEERHLRDEARDLYEALRRQYDSIVSELAEARERLDRVEQENEALTARVGHLETENHDLLLERDRLRRRVALLSDEVEKLGGHAPPEEN